MGCYGSSSSRARLDGHVILNQAKLKKSGSEKFKSSKVRSGTEKIAAEKREIYFDRDRQGGVHNLCRSPI